MGKNKLHRIPARGTLLGDDLYVSELTSEESGVSLRGRFEIPIYARLDDDQRQFLETFLRCRGMLNSVERELGISYPTVRARLDGLLEALGLTPAKSDDEKKDRAGDRKRKVLEELEQGEITAEEAKEKLGAIK